MIWLYSKAQRLKSLLLILVYTYTALQSGPGPCFQSHTSGKVWFLDILYLSSLGVLDQGYLVFFIFFLSDKCLPTLPNSAEMSPILWRFSPAIQTEFCSLYVGNTHIVILTLISLHSFRTHTLSPATSTIMVRSMPSILRHPDPRRLCWQCLGWWGGSLSSRPIHFCFQQLSWC